MPGTRFQVPQKTLTPPSQLELSLDNKNFCAYHQANPHIYQEFKKLTLVTISKGFKNYSSKGIIELIRWQTGISSKGDCFKINNNYSSFYARKFAAEFPEHKDFFRNRESRFD